MAYPENKTYPDCAKEEIEQANKAIKVFRKDTEKLIRDHVKKYSDSQEAYDYYMEKDKQIIKNNNSGIHDWQSGYCIYCQQYFTFYHMEPRYCAKCGKPLIKHGTAYWYCVEKQFNDEIHEKARNWY